MKLAWLTTYYETDKRIVDTKDEYVAIRSFMRDCNVVCDWVHETSWNLLNPYIWYTTYGLINIEDEETMGNIQLGKRLLPDNMLIRLSTRNSIKIDEVFTESPLYKNREYITKDWAINEHVGNEMLEMRYKNSIAKPQTIVSQGERP